MIHLKKSNCFRFVYRLSVGIKIYLTLFLAALILKLIISATQQIRKPEIISQFETIIEPNNNHSILCQGDRPLKWTIPEVMVNRNVIFG